MTDVHREADDVAKRKAREGALQEMMTFAFLAAAGAVVVLFLLDFLVELSDWGVLEGIGLAGLVGGVLVGANSYRRFYREAYEEHRGLLERSIAREQAAGEVDEPRS